MHPGGRNHPYGTEKQDRDADKLQFVDAEQRGVRQIKKHRFPGFFGSWDVSPDI